MTAAVIACLRDSLGSEEKEHTNSGDPFSAVQDSNTCVNLRIRLGLDRLLYVGTAELCSTFG